MKIMIADCDKSAINALKKVVNELKPDAEIDCFDGYSGALAASKTNNYDAAFLETDLHGESGLELAKSLGKTNIIFISYLSDRAADAFAVNASGYILKPAKRTDIANALENLRYPVARREHVLRAQCFGNFEVFSNGEPLKFKRSMAKEMLAYLINLRGAAANTNELCAVLFDSDSASNKHYLRNIISDLKRTLNLHGASSAFICMRNCFSVCTDRIDCDYYRFLDADPVAVNSYLGEYMKQYSWAESTNGFLSLKNKTAYR